MSLQITKRLEKLAVQSRSSGLFALAAAANCASYQPEDLNSQINLVGALQEAGKLKNSLAPYWKAWRKEEVPWVRQCVQRLKEGDSDYWALAALLGCNVLSCHDVLKEAGFLNQSLRYYANFIGPAHVHVAVYAPETTGRVWAPLIEIGYDPDSKEVLDVYRWRAVVWKNQDVFKGSVIGNGSGTYYMRASLPFGVWRSQDLEFKLNLEQVVEQVDLPSRGLTKHKDGAGDKS